jgi:hypothetical protein
MPHVFLHDDIRASWSFLVLRFVCQLKRYGDLGRGKPCFPFDKQIRLDASLVPVQNYDDAAPS